MATYSKRESGWWQAKVRVKGHPAQSKTFPTKAAAEKWATVVEAEMHRGVFVSRVEAEGTTMKEVLERYGREVSPAKRKEEPPKRLEKAELRRLDALIEEFGKLSLAGLQSKHIAAWRDKELKRGLAGATVIKSLNLLSHAIDTAVKEWGLHIPANPCKLISKPKVAKARERRLQAGELDALVKHAQSPELAAIIRLAVETAMRRGELLGLRWENIDLRRRTAHLPETKNGEARTVPLSPAAAVLLKALPGRKGGVFGYTSPDSITQGFEIAVRRARAAYEKEGGKNAAFLNDLRFHDLRHEATSRLFESGRLELMEVAAITGHKTLQMLKRYTHLKAEELAKKLR